LKNVIVSGFLRNDYWRLKKYDFEEYVRIKGKRDKCETLHSILKDQLNFDKNLAGKGWDKVMIYTLQFLITLLIVAIIRAENGVDKGFMKISDGVFS
jgi:hypothetical protein